MNIKGYNLGGRHWLQARNKVLRQEDGFVHSDLLNALVDLGVPTKDDVAYEAASRMIRQMKNKFIIVFDDENKLWIRT